MQIAGERKIIFKLHPNENFERAIAEIKSVAGPEALIYTDGNADHMVANCDELITQYSTLVYVGIGLGKKVHSYFNLHDLYDLMPWQNGGTSAKRIAKICKEFIAFDGSGEEYLHHHDRIHKLINYANQNLHIPTFLKKTS